MVVRISNGLFLEVIEQLPILGLPIEVDIYDGDDPATMLATIEGARDVAWTDPFGDIGSGTFLLPVNDPKATPTIIRSGNLVKIKLAGLYVYAYWLENPKVVAASVDGKAGKFWTLGGRGAAAYLERGGVYPVGWPTVTATEHVFVGATFGKILGDLIDLARARGSMPDLTYDFTDALDSHGEAWTQTVNITVRAGVSILDLSRQLIGLGMESRMTTDLKLQAYVDVARSLEATVIIREGYHLRDQVVRELQDASLRSRVLVQGADGNYAEAFDPVVEAVPRFGRREGFVDFTSSSDPTTLQVVANQSLETYTSLTEAISIPVAHGPATEGQYEPYITYRNGDWIGLNVPGFYDLQSFRVASISVAMVEGGGYEVDLDLNSVAVEHIVTLKRMIDALSGGSSGAATAGSGSTSGVVGPSGGGGSSSGSKVASEFGDSPGFLYDKIAAGSGVTKALIGASGSRQVQIVASAPVLGIDALTDVDTVAVPPTNGQALVFDLATGLWKPGTIAGGGGGGGGSTLPLDVAPGTAHAKDDEFAGTVLDAKWTSGFKAATKTVGGGWLNIAAAGAGFAHFIRQVAPTGAFSILGKFAQTPGYTLSDTRPGLMIAQGTKAISIGLGLSGGPSKAMWIEHSNYSEVADWGGYNGNWSGNIGGTYAGGPIWFRARWVPASSTIFTDFSVDGVVWYQFSSRAGWSQPDRIGIVLENNSGNTVAGESISVDWFRVTEP